MTRNEAHGERAEVGYAFQEGSENLSEASELISAFREIDCQLREALEKDDIELIQQFSKQADELIEKMIGCACENSGDRKLLMTFLIERFVLENADEEGLKRRICDRLLAEISD